MRYIILTFLLLQPLLLGCGNNQTNDSVNLTVFNNTELKTDLKNSPFEPKLPTKMPFSVNNASIQSYNDNSIEISFDGPGKTKRGNHIILLIAKADDSPFPRLTNSKEVTIGKMNGFYGEEIAKLKTLDWKDNGIYYQMRFLWNKSDTTVTMKDLIETAKSFK